MRYWDYVSRATGTHTHNLAPAAQVGYAWTLGDFVVDLRLSQPVAIFSSSSAEHTSPEAAIRFSPVSRVSPVLPLLGVTVGYAF